jgi:CheY-like chemotaxis protein
VEDEADVREQTTLILEDFFHQVIAVADGPSALAAAQKTRPDLLITDLLMPGQNGLELIAAMKSGIAAKLPCLITTAHTDTHYLLEAIELGVDGYILKPLSAQSLLESAHKALLPIHQSRELNHYRNLINALGLLVGGRKIDILQHLINHLDDQNYFHGSYSDIMAAVDVSKPTVIKLFRDLMEAGALERVKNGLYHFKSEALTRPKPAPETVN